MPKKKTKISRRDFLRLQWAKREMERIKAERERMMAQIAAMTDEEQRAQLLNIDTSGEA